MLLEPLSHVHDVAVIVTALLAVAVSSVWYSPIAFGPLWMRETKRSSEQEENTVFVARNVVWSVFVYIMLYYALGYVLVESARYKIPETPFLISLFVVGAMLLLFYSIREERSVRFAFMTVAHFALIAFGGASILLFWPW